MGVCNRDFSHHHYRFYGEHGFIEESYFGHKGFIVKSPCRSSVKKLTPEAVLIRADLCDVYHWKECILDDGKDHILDRMTYHKAWRCHFRDIVNNITPNKMIRELRSSDEYQP